MAKNNRGGGFKGTAVSLILLLLIAGGLVAVAKINNITSVAGLYQYAKSWSDKVDSCTGVGEWKCSTGSEGSGDSGSSSDTNSSGNTNPASGSGSESESTATDGDSEASLLAKLDTLKVEKPKDVDYNRSEWKHWIKISGECDTRETVLAKQGTNVQSDPKTCKVLSGTWKDPYTGKNFTDPKKLDIDHVIPLGYVASHGGQSWDKEKKKAYANDIDTVLLAVSASENRSKSDKGPEDYMPPDESFSCEYGKKWVDIASKYGISITSGDKKALTSALQSCSA